MYKLIIFTATFLLMTVTLSHGQTSFLLGVSGGASLSKFKGTGDFASSGENYNRAIRYGGGVDLGVGFGNFAVLTGFRYNQRGGKSTNERLDLNSAGWLITEGNNVNEYFGERKTEFNMTVFTLPVLLRYSFGSGPLQILVGAGPVINFVSGQVVETRNYELLGDIQKGPFEDRYDTGNQPDDLFRKTNIGVQFRTGAIYQLNDNGFLKMNACLETVGNLANKNAQYYDAYTDTYNKFNGSIKSNNFMLELGYEHRFEFNIGSKY